MGLIYVIVLAWNHKDETVASLKSLMQSNYPQLRFAIVDNASTDGTAQTVSELFPTVEIIQSPTNLGISGGYNLGMEYALCHGADFVLVANNDIVVDPSMIRNLRTALERHPKAGMAMPKIYHYYGDQRRLWCPGAYWRRFPPEVKMQVEVRDVPRFNVLREIDYAPSCCLLIGREALEQVGRFDTGYFFYYDDWDLSIRLRKAGYRILFVPDAKLWHKVSVSTQKSERPAQWWRVMGRSTVLFYLRHATPWALFLFITWFMVRESLKLQFGRIPPFLIGLLQGLHSYRGFEE